ncbi:response regulator [Oceanobacillus sp. FSL H7-0719]|uniref:response regulator n=1 Tax=Oceanobacillus sp. FSL H7-0719 TaxID=2954507 RepID=UPI003246D535
MRKVVIAEDDRIIRRGLLETIPWEENGISIVGDAGDGEVALELVAKEQPAIIISDIRMPFMSGLEMAKQVNKKNPYTKIIFLTGYQDFKYAQEAVKLNAFDFLLKPIDSDLLLEKVKKAGDEWAAEIARERTIMKSLPLLQEKFLKQLIENDNETIDIENELKELNILLEGPCFLAVLIYVSPENNEDIDTVKAELEIFLSERNGALLQKSLNNFALFLSAEEEGLFVISDLFHRIKGRIAGKVTITLGRQYENLFEIKKSFMESYLAMELRYILGEGKLYSIEDATLEAEENNSNLRGLEQKLERQIKMGLPKEVILTLNELDFVSRKQMLPLQEIKIFSIKYSTILFNEIEKWKKTAVDSSIFELYQSIAELETLNEIKSSLIILVEEWANSMEQNEENSLNSLVDQAISYLQSNYHQAGLTLQRVADVVHVSAPYLSNLFKAEKGFNFGDYLIKLRMEKAMEILRRIDVKSYEVAESVGYSNPQYFSTCFKKYTGYTPREYQSQFQYNNS